VNNDNSELSAYLASSEVIDWQDDAVRQQAAALVADDRPETAKRCFEFVRDEIAHSVDIDAEQLTCRASEVLRLGHGYCYAKSHLLAALLRANAIPSGFDYQRLDDDDGHFMLHGFNTLYLPPWGWYRLDARGNKPGVDAQFMPPMERLAWSNEGPGEVHYRINLSAPLPQVVAALQQPLTVAQLWPVLPSEIAPLDS
jgi:transglutaminase-like putative cysteine protease